MPLGLFRAGSWVPCCLVGQLVCPQQPGGGSNICCSILILTTIRQNSAAKGKVLHNGHCQSNKQVVEVGWLALDLNIPLAWTCPSGFCQQQQWEESENKAVLTTLRFSAYRSAPDGLKWKVVNG